MSYLTPDKQAYFGYYNPNTGKNVSIRAIDN